MLCNVPNRLKQLAGLAVAVSVSTACSSVLVVVPPRNCPVMNEAAVLELTKMELDGTFPNTREYVLDQVVPYCDGIEAMRSSWLPRK